MDDGQDRVVQALVMRALANIQQRTSRADWPQWFVDQLEELALEAYAHGIQHVHRRTTVPAPAPKLGWDENGDAHTPVKDVWKP